MKWYALFPVALLLAGCIPDPADHPFGGKPEPPTESSLPGLDDAQNLNGSESKPNPAPTEQCDTAGCPSCRVDADEVCDDGNNANGDGCNPTCSLTTKVTTTLSGLDKPWGITTDGRTAWIANHGSCTLVSVDLETGTAARLAGSLGACSSRDGRGGAAEFDHPSDLTVVGQFLYILDEGSGKIRRVDRDSAEVTTLALRRPGSSDEEEEEEEEDSITLDKPSGIASDGRTLFVSETGAQRVLAIELSSGTVRTLTADLEEPMGLATDGSTLWVVDKQANAIFALPVSGGDARLLSGNESQPGARDGIGAEARFEKPVGLALADDGSLYVTEEEHVVRQVELADARTTTLAGVAGKSGAIDEMGVAARFDKPRGVATYGEAPHQVVLVTEYDTGVLRRIE